MKIAAVETFVVANPPPSFGERDLGDARYGVLRAIPTPDDDLVRRQTVRARYRAGTVGERDVPDFIEADHSKMTAKFTRIPALSDVPFADTNEAAAAAAASLARSA